MKKTWIETFDSLLKIINDADPVSLIAGGAPEDEYEIEVLDIFTQLKKGQIDTNNVYDIVLDSFVQKFGANTLIDQKKIREIENAIKHQVLV